MKFVKKGFLIVELIIALGLLSLFVALIGRYQLQVNLYNQAAQQLYQATCLCENTLEELLAGACALNNQTQIGQIYTINTQINSGPGLAYYDVQVGAEWLNVFGQRQKIKLCAVCL